MDEVKKIAIIIIVIVIILFKTSSANKIDLSKLDTSNSNITELQAQSIADYIHNELLATWIIDDESIINMLKPLNKPAKNLVIKKFGYRDLSARHLGILEPFYSENLTDLNGWIYSLNNEEFTAKYNMIMN